MICGVREVFERDLAMPGILQTTAQGVLPRSLYVKLRTLVTGTRFPDPYLRAQCVFVHVPKVAGSSIALALFGDETTGHAHMTWEDYFYENRSRYRRFFSFGFVRNPWDRLASAYRYLCDVPEQHKFTRAWSLENVVQYSDFADFICALRDRADLRAWPHLRPQSEFLANGDQVMVDFVGHYETLATDLTLVAERLRIDVKKVPHVNSSGPRRHYSHHYDVESAAIVGEIYARDVSLFGYRFEDVPEGGA